MNYGFYKFENKKNKINDNIVHEVKNSRISGCLRVARFVFHCIHLTTLLYVCVCVCCVQIKFIHTMDMDIYYNHPWSSLINDAIIFDGPDSLSDTCRVKKSFSILFILIVNLLL